MLINSGVVTLNYDPATDILATSLPDVTPRELPQVRYCLGLIAEGVRNYDIKSLLMDCSKSVVEDEGETHKALARQLSTDLMKTRLRKLAWVAATNAGLCLELRRELSLSIEFRNFSSKAEAMGWLLQPEQPSGEEGTAPAA